MKFSARHSPNPIQHHYDLSSGLDDSSDYSSTYSGDDSGFSQSSWFRKRPIVKHGTRVLPDLPSQEAASSNSHYYKSLNKHEDVSYEYYKTLEKEAVEGQLHNYTNIHITRLPKYPLVETIALYC